MTSNQAADDRDCQQSDPLHWEMTNKTFEQSLYNQRHLNLLKRIFFILRTGYIVSTLFAALEMASINLVPRSS